MNKVLSLTAALVVAAAVTGLAFAGNWSTGKSAHLNAQNPTAAFSLRISRPEKILLFVNAVKVTATTRCTKGTTVSKLTRSFATDGSRNLLWHIAGRQDACRVSVSASLRGSNPGYVAVDVMKR
jgi:hypothetical protein